MKRKFALLLICALTVTSLSACGSAASETKNATSEQPIEATQESEKEPVGEQADDSAASGLSEDAESYSGTIQVWSWTNDPEYQIAAFEKAYPNIKDGIIFLLILTMRIPVTWFPIAWSWLPIRTGICGR